MVGIRVDRWIVTAAEQTPSACAAIAQLGRVGLVARKLGIEVSPSFLLRVNRVYEDEAGKADPRLKGRY